MYLLFISLGKFKFDLKLCCTIHLISHIHHIMEYFAELFFVHSDLSFTPQLANDFSSDCKNLDHICMHVNSVWSCAYREKLDWQICIPDLSLF